MKTYTYEESRWSGPFGFMHQVNEYCHCCKSTKVIGVFGTQEEAKNYVEYCQKKVLQSETESVSIKQ